MPKMERADLFVIPGQNQSAMFLEVWTPHPMAPNPSGLDCESELELCQATVEPISLRCPKLLDLSTTTAVLLCSTSDPPTREAGEAGACGWKPPRRGFDSNWQDPDFLWTN